MDFDKLILKRESVRKYTDKKIPREDIIKCVKAAQYAPSAKNSQPWTFVVVDDKELVKKMAELTCTSLVKFNKFTKAANVIVAVVIERTHFAKIGSYKSDSDYNFIDIGIATEHFCLQATQIGLGTCILGYFQDAKIKKLLNIDKKKEIGLLISVGYGVHDEPRDKKRKSFDDMCKFNSYK